MWAHEFVKPAACIGVEAVLDGAIPAATYDHREDFPRQGVEFEEGYNGTARVVWAQTATITLIYTSSGLDYNLWPSAFLQIVVWRLAGDLALALTGSGDLQTRMSDGYDAALKMAIAQDTPPNNIRRLQENASFPDLTSDVGIINAALYRCGASTVLSALDDGSPVATAAASILPVVIRKALSLRGWRFATREIHARAVAPGSSPTWRYEYSLPDDCLKVISTLAVRRHHPSHRTSELFVPIAESQVGFNGNAPVLWANIEECALVYLSDAPTYAQWPDTFVDYVIWSLAAALAPSAVDIATMQTMQNGAQIALDLAIMQDSPSSIMMTHYVPDFMRVRDVCGHAADHEPRRPYERVPQSGYVVAQSRAVSPKPAYLRPPQTENGVPDAGLQVSDIANGRWHYIAGDTPDGRIGILEPGISPPGWRTPVHHEIVQNEALQEGDQEA